MSEILDGFPRKFTRFAAAIALLAGLMSFLEGMTWDRWSKHFSLAPHLVASGCWAFMIFLIVFMAAHTLAWVFGVVPIPGRPNSPRRKAA